MAGWVHGRLNLITKFLVCSMNYWPTFSKTFPQQPSIKEMLAHLESIGEGPVLTLMSNKYPLLRESPWWGVSNSKWNPPKN